MGRLGLGPVALVGPSGGGRLGSLHSNSWAEEWREGHERVNRGAGPNGRGEEKDFGPKEKEFPIYE